MNTHNDMKIVTPEMKNFFFRNKYLRERVFFHAQRLIFSPESGGRVKPRRARAEINIQGRTRLNLNFQIPVNS